MMKQAFQMFYRSIFFAAQPWWADLYANGIFIIYLKMKRLKNL